MYYIWYSNVLEILRVPLKTYHFPIIREGRYSAELVIPLSDSNFQDTDHD